MGNLEFSLSVVEQMIRSGITPPTSLSSQIHILCYISEFTRIAMNILFEYPRRGDILF